ncbi:hypothetical protein AGLY_012649 [Aphis glycines]|uniref:Uncharacterized protein n=1 Tax=Aphis glycines TaxID=307491 RepID=A0A6G0T8Z6_APHGL|nr:hypothetical protein AGLY_012649 [Aphis glycines]
MSCILRDNVGVHTPRNSLSIIFVNEAPFPGSLAACNTPSCTFLQLKISYLLQEYNNIKINTYRYISFITENTNFTGRNFAILYPISNVITIQLKQLQVVEGARGGSPSSAALSMPPAKTTSIVDSQQEMGCLRENASAPTRLTITWTEVITDVERTEHAMRHVKVRVHLPFGHLAGKFQKRFGVHAVVISNGVPTKNRGRFCAVYCRRLPGKLSIVGRADLPADREIIIAPCPGE